MKLMQQIIALFLIIAAFCRIFTMSQTAKFKQKENALGQPAEDRVQIRVYRGPNNMKNGVQWAYYVKQPADFH
ncbi:unnamed protein product [Hermetia illucens]|uniref:Uncharacterized protein n=1 Tax=Hermetia illucens TaxID=343691 RepID=A0A7R8UC17_HERIL|nr:unnamed protein product [Hermetia illucens]